MIKTRWVIIFYLMILFGNKVYGFQQTDYAKYNPNQKIKFKHIGEKEGLSQGHGVCIHQDYLGFMWFGTMDGLNMYDGYNITIYRNNPKDTALLTDNSITAIYEDKQKYLWIGTSSGLNRFDRSTGKFIKYYAGQSNSNSISNNSITTILQDKRGNLWIGTNGGGLNLYDPKEKKFSKYSFSLPNKKGINSNYINTIYEDRKGNLWVGTRYSGVCFIAAEDGSFKNYRHNPKNNLSLSDNHVTKIAEDNEGNLWIGTLGSGLDKFDIKSNSFKNYRYNSKDEHSIGSDIIYDLIQDKKGNIWIGTENGGLNLYNPKSDNFIRYTNNMYDRNSLTSNSISALYEDISGNIWLGTHRGGINYFNTEGEKFNHYYQEVNSSSLSNNNVRAFYEDNHGKIWIGTDGGGLNVFDPKTSRFSIYNHDEKNTSSISSNIVLSIVGTKEGNLWLATWGGGLNYFYRENKSFTKFYHEPKNPSSLGSNKIVFLLKDSKENLWVGTFDGGLNKFINESERFIRYKYDPDNANSISNNYVKSICEDLNGKIWIATPWGLNLFDPLSEKFIRFHANAKKRGSISDNNINSLLIDRKGNLWVGTQKGLNLYNRKTNSFTVFKEKDGLCNNSIQCMQEDLHGNLWVTTFNGLSKFNPEKRIFENFTVNDGLQGNEFLINSCLRAKTGELYFGGINGFNVFNPDSIKNNPDIPPVYLTGFQLHNRSVTTETINSPLKQSITLAKEINLTPEQSVISFEFVALNYISPEMNRYAYKLEGFDDMWNYVGNQRKATYTNLDPGRYVFKVKAANNDGIWNEKGTSIRIIIAPPYWKTGWFKLGIILSILLTVFFAHYGRTKQIKSQNKKLEAKVQERTLQIEHQKELISSNLELLKNYNEEVIHQKFELEQKVEERTKELKASNEELILLTNALPVLITYVDQEQRYRFNNQTYEQWFGIKKAEVYGKRMREVMGEKEFSKIQKYIEKALQGESQHIQTWLKYPMLGDRFVSIDYIPHVHEDEVLGFYALVSDITEQEKIKEDLEKALRKTKDANEELRKTNVDLDNFVYTASHDLKSPIANLEGITHFLFRRLNEKLNAEEKEVLVMIHKMTTKLKGTINDLTEISKIQKELDQPAEPISFEEIFEDIKLDLQPLINNNVKITTEWEVKVIQYARKNLRSILYNLTANALKYSATNRKAHIHIHTFSKDDQIILKVSDNGLGMAPYQLSSLFTMFKRFHKHVEGTGIGLYMTKRIIENYGGKIDVESEENKGTTFTVSFKVEKPLLPRVVHSADYNESI